MRGLKCLLESALLLMLCGQTFLLLTLSYRGYWDIPTWLVERMINGKVPSSLSVEVGMIRFFPGKGLEVIDLQLNSEECECPVLTVGKIVLIPSDPTLGIARSESAVGLITNGILYYPDPFLPASENLQLIEDLSLRFELNRNSIQLGSLKAKMSRLTVASRNVVRLPLTELGFGRAEQESFTFSSEAVFRKLREMKFLHESFEQAEQALLTLSFDSTPNPDRPLSAALSLHAASSLLLDDISAQGVFLEGRVYWDGAFGVEDDLRGEIQSLRYRQEVRAENLAVAFSYLQDRDFSLVPDEVRLQVPELSFRGREFEFVGVTMWPEPTGQGQLRAAVGYAGESVALEADYDLGREWMAVRVSGDFDPLVIASSWTKGLEGFSLFGFEAVPSLRASFEVQSWKELSPIEFRALGTSIVAKGVLFDYGRTWGRWDGVQRRIMLDEFIGQRSGYTLGGSLDNTLGFGPYRYRIIGRGIPTDLNPMFRSWWSSTWTDFDFRDHPIQVDLDIWGVESDPLQRFVYGSMGFAGMDYKGLDIERGQVTLNSIPRYLQLLDLVVKTPNGVASGDIGIVYDPLEARQMTEHLDLYTNLPLHVLAPLVGDDLDPLVENTRPETVADVWLQGTLVKEAFPEHRHRDVLNLRVQVRRPTWFYGFQVDAADAYVRKHQNRIEIHPVDLRFAGGHGNGLLVGYEDENGGRVDFSVDLRDVDFRQAVEKIEGLRHDATEGIPATPDGMPVEADRVEQDRASPVAAAPRAATPPETWDVPTESEARSTLKVRLAGSSPADTLSGLRAWGDFELQDPLIHRVHLFGGLSKALSKTELNLGSFSLKEARSTVRFEGERLFFEDLELTGPSSRVRSKGVVDLEDGGLDFRLKAYPLREVKFPVVAGLALVLRPFAHMFEVQLTGTLKEPEWKLVIDPSGL